MSTKSQNKGSPYKVFENWLQDRSNNDLEEWVVKSLNPAMVLGMFGGLKRGTIFLNKYFNSYNVFKFPTNKLFQAFKQTYKKSGGRKSNLTFLKVSFKKQSVNKLLEYFPHLKNYEAKLLLEKLELISDKEEYQSFIESIGLEIPKKSGKRGRKKKTLTKSKTKKEVTKTKIWTFNDWVSSVKGEYDE